MKSTTEIKYKYARNSENRIVYIEELEKTNDIKQEVFTCISCGNLLIPKLGKIRQKHFAHKYVQNCSKETYLHRLAKLAFAQEYQSCLDRKEPFYIELEIGRKCNAYEKHFGKVCCLESIYKTFDLTKRYVKVDVEKKDGDFVPDILLSNELGTKKIFIEIAVTHQITQEKVQSQIEIIEISIKNEEDILSIRQRIIRQTDSKIKLVNFDIKPEEGNLCNGQSCRERIGLFQVYKNGKSILTWQSLPKTYFLIERRKPSLLNYKVISSDKQYTWSDEYKKNIVDAYNAKIAIKNCFLCRYHGENSSYYGENLPVFCKFLKIKCNSNQASACQYYRPDPKCFPGEVNISPEERKICKGQDYPIDAPVSAIFFLVLKSGNSFLLDLSSFTFIAERIEYKFLYYKSVDFGENSSWRDEYKKNVVNAYKANIPIKNCFLCRHRREDEFGHDKDETISCNFLKIKCESNEASMCEYYQPDHNCFPEQIDSD